MKMHKKEFKNIATLVCYWRTKKNLRNVDISNACNYNDHGHFCYSLEKQLYGLPPNKITQLAKSLEISEDLIISSMVQDYASYLRKFIEVKND